MFFFNSGDKAERYFYYMSIQHYTELFKMKERRRREGGEGEEGEEARASASWPGLPG